MDTARKLGVSRVLLLMRKRVGAVSFELTTYDTGAGIRQQVWARHDLTANRLSPGVNGLTLPEILPEGDRAAVQAFATSPRDVRGQPPAAAL
ncbi:hypothetical protein EON77_12695, partial [bacterium]